MPEEFQLDEFLTVHLDQWLNHAAPPEDREAVKAEVLRCLTEHPDLIDRGWSWWKILDLAREEAE